MLRFSYAVVASHAPRFVTRSRTMAIHSIIRVLCVDDHELLSEGMAGRMALEKDMQCVGRLTQADDLVREAKATNAKVVLLDLEMPGRDPLEALADLMKAMPEIKVLILSAHMKDSLIDMAVQRGAAGYFLKSDSPTTILKGIRDIVANKPAFSALVEERLAGGRGASDSVDATATRLQALTPRELEILRMIGQGLSRAEIAKRLFRSLKTVDAHHTAIMRKLDIHDRAELTRYVIREGLAQA
jgi:DNA-binding NarL/FixJ family response regulator